MKITLCTGMIITLYAQVTKTSCHIEAFLAIKSQGTQLIIPC